MRLKLGLRRRQICGQGVGYNFSGMCTQLEEIDAVSTVVKQ